MIKHSVTGAALLMATFITGCAMTTPVAPTDIPTPEPPTSIPQVGTIIRQFPDRIDASQRYVIYLHGRIIEDEGTRPVSPVFGVYEYEETLEALAQAGLNVIAEVRSSNTDAVQYAVRVADQVNELLEEGVPPEHITVMGFSKGGAIAIFASTHLQDEK